MLENLFLLTNFVLACSFFVLRTHICLMVLLSGGVCWSAPGRGTPALEEKRCRLGVVHFTPMLILRTASHEEKKGHCSSPRCIPDSIEKYLLPCPPILSSFSFLSLPLHLSFPPEAATCVRRRRRRSSAASLPCLHSRTGGPRGMASRGRRMWPCAVPWRERPSPVAAAALPLRASSL